MTSGILLVNLLDSAKPLFGPDDPQPLYLVILLGSILLVGGAAMIWAIYFRKRKNPASPARHHSKSDETSSKKNRRRGHRPRNPTLAETGGLPPPRAEDSSNRFG